MSLFHIKTGLKAALGLAASLAFCLPAQALVTSADSIGYCFDAEGGLREGAPVITWNCHDQANQQFWLDRLSPTEFKAVLSKMTDEQIKQVGGGDLAVLRVGSYCVHRDGDSMVLRTSGCDKSNNPHVWFAQNVGGTRYRFVQPQSNVNLPYCASLSNHEPRGRRVWVHSCILQPAGDNAMIMHFRQFWWVKQ
jgi:hypothetical protein